MSLPRYSCASNWGSWYLLLVDTNSCFLRLVSLNVSALNVFNVLRSSRIDGDIDLSRTNVRHKATDPIVCETADEEAKEAREGVDLPGSANLEVVIDRVCKAWHKRSDTNGECCESTPVDTVPILVDAVSVVQLMNVEFLVEDEVVLADHHATNTAHECRVPGQECEQTCCISNDLPWIRNDTEDGDEECGAEDVDVLGTETRDIVAERVGSGSDLITDGGEHEGQGSEKFRGAAVKVCNDGRHVPLELSIVLVGVGTCDEDGTESSKGTDDWESEVLIVAGQTILRESRKIWKVDSHRREKSHDNIDSCKRRVRRAHIGRGHLCFPGDQRSATIGDDGTPEEKGEERGRDHDTFDEEQDAKLLDGHQS
jgi:hypothetical protein